MLRLLFFSRLIMLLMIPFSMSSPRWRASASMTLWASLTEMTWAVMAEVVVARIPMMVAKMIGPEITRRLLLKRACSVLAGEWWIELVLPFMH